MRPSASGSTRRSGWFGHPVLSLLLAASWLALSRSLEPVHLLSAILIGLVVPRMLGGFLWPGRSIDWLAALRLLMVVLWDIVVANITVARLVLGPMGRPQPLWMAVPLACDHPRVNALLASIITTTPGTVSAVVDERRQIIWVHALDCSDPEAMVADMKHRYEAALLRVFRLPEGDRP